ncbi:P-loop containing nucleoside triphosphate hydrolase protein [Mycena metata]|uniref:P-loop containing nucleoside triphosphate hydrolase protein n=1 Tax=Mycena metata TaxID=1033252 RepID=A0AAD7HCF8_9AGAR|nr:P-loop containing nucleoside triphosphate hydrolase protein [Mycena metata]
MKHKQISSQAGTMSGVENAQTGDSSTVVLCWHSLFFTFAELLETFGWIGSTGAIYLSHYPGFTPVVRSIASPPTTAPYDLFAVYVLQFAGGFLLLGGHLFGYATESSPLPSIPCLVGLLANLLLVFALLCVIVQMPTNLPPAGIKTEDIKDYAPLWGWITLNFVYPLIKRDVWSLSPTMQSRPVFMKFERNLYSVTLLRHLIASNSLDLILDFVGAVLAVALQYSGPFFLKRLLDSIDRSGLMFLASLLKVSSLVHSRQTVGYGRRAMTHIRSELMAAIYDKALRRRDFSGTVGGDKAKASAGLQTPIDTGKIVNLMSSDAETLSYNASSFYALLVAPFEIVIGSGWSAFTGFGVLGFEVGQGLAKTKDKRMSIVNELLGSIKFIKFFAWENRWIDLWNAAPILLSLISFFTFVWLGNELTVGKAFAAIALFSMLRLLMFSTALPSSILQLTQARVSLNRIAAYLAEDEVTAQETTNPPEVLGSIQPSVSPDVNTIDTDHRLALKNISVVFPEGRLSVITGPTASGKTALLLALMGEMTLLPGGRIITNKNSSVDEHGNTHGIAYAAQSPWLRHQSIKDNILFGTAMDRERYQAVIECCALKPDFDVLEDGDVTEIGAKGVSLSGGQKARVALARAVYARKRYVLLDDPLRSVLCDTLLVRPNLANRTVVDAFGHPSSVRILGDRSTLRVRCKELRAQGDAVEVEKEEVEGVASETKPRKLVEDEHREIGSVKLSVLSNLSSRLQHTTSGSHSCFLVVVSQFKGVAEKLWIKVWAEAYTPGYLVQPLTSTNQTPLARHKDGRLPKASDQPLFYVGVYAAIGLFGILVHLIVVALQWTGAVRAARILFKRLLVSVVRATFSVLFPPFLLPASIITFLYRSLAIGYLNTGRDLRRMESNNRSPIFSNFEEVLTGIVTVRAFSVEKRFLQSFFDNVDKMTEVGYIFWMTNRWLLLNFDFLGIISVFTTALFAIAMLHEDAGLAGLAITSALSFSQSVYWACQCWTGLELTLNSVERIADAENSSLVVVEDLVIKYAPDLPAVLHDVSFELKAGERVGLVGRTGSGKSSLVMSLLRFATLCMSPLQGTGRIVIDGIDILKIGIHDLRSRITFIPQDATLFSGTLRENLDPFGKFKLGASPPALKYFRRLRGQRVPGRLAKKMRLTSQLSPARVWDLLSAGGNNFSQGQRQLIALARALLRRSSIVVMDEATSSVDVETDTKIQATIRAEFSGSLLITVAHRLRTIVNYDRLLVLDKGRVVESDTPLRLMHKGDGIFRDMCLKSGTFGELEALAKAKKGVV